MKDCLRFVALAALITGEAVLGQTASFSPSSVSFGNVGVNATSTISVTLNNTSATTNLTITSLTGSGAPFTLAGGCTTRTSIGAQGSCNLNIKFTPTAVGPVTGAVTLDYNVGTTPTTLTLGLSGTGIVDLTYSPSSLTFASTPTGSTSAAQQVTFNNVGPKVSISSVTVSPNFAVNNSCSPAFAAQSTCTIGVSFQPTVTGPLTGTLTVVDGLGTQTVGLSGTAIGGLTSITVAPAAGTLMAGSTLQYTATGNYSDGTTQNLTSSATWASSSTPTATIAAGGLATGVAAGTTTISAKSGTVTGRVNLVVTAATLTSIAVTPANASLEQAATQQYTATGTFSDGTKRNITTIVTWGSSNTAAASISAGGLATAVAAGTSTISATSGTVVSSTGLTVTGMLTSIAVTPANGSIAAGATQQYAATGTYSDGSTKNLTSSVTWSSSPTTTATITAAGLAKGAAAGAATISASASGVTGSTGLTVTAATLKSIAITPANASIAEGTTEQYTATGTFSDGSHQNITTSSTVSWISSAPTIATIASGASGGVATPVAAGATTITATSGTIVSNSVTLTVTAATLTSIAVTPVNSNLAVGLTQLFKAVGTYSNNTTETITTSVVWSSSAPTLASITASGGDATGVAAGAVTISATLSGITGSTKLTVVAPTLTAIAISPTSTSVAAGLSTPPFTAMGTYNNGTTQPIPAGTAGLTWSSSNVADATIASTGIATGLAAGTVTITASMSGVTSNAATLTVTAATLTSIAITPATASIAAGQTDQFTATGTMSNGTTQALTTGLTWVSSTTTVATIAASGLATSLIQGTTAIAASYTPSGGGAAIVSPAFTLTVTAPVITSISITPATASIVAGQTQAYAATGNLSNNTTQPLTTGVTWSSSNTADATIAATGIATGVAAGGVTITASYTPSGGGVAITNTSALTVVGVVSIAVTPANLTFGYPNTESYVATATLTNGTPLTVTANSMWASSKTAVATIVSTTGVATAVTAGTTTISATYAGVTGTTGLTITNTQTGITVTPGTSTINVGSTELFTPYPTFNDGTTGTTAVTGATWISSNTSVATVDSTGNATAVGPGTTNITATSGTYTASGVLTVTNPCAAGNAIDLKILVITNHMTEADFPAITTALSYLQMPYMVYDYTAGALTANMLSSGCHAFYNGVIMAFLDGTTYNTTTTPSTLPFTGYDVLQTFEASFGIRQLNWYTYPAPSLGLNYPTGSQDGDTAAFTSEAAPVFTYMNQATPLVIDPNAYTLLTTPIAGTSLLNDSNGNSLIVDYPIGDGREYLSNTFDSNQYMLHEQLINYGEINWVTKGMFVGEKHIYFTAQEDDIGMDDDIYTTNTGNFLQVEGVTQPAVGSLPACTSPVSTVTGMAYRISGADATAFLNWQTSRQSSDAQYKNVKLYNAYVSCGLISPTYVDPNCGSVGAPYPDTTLNTWILDQANTNAFGWIDHTYEHEDLHYEDNGVTNQPYSVDYTQINTNLLNEASTLNFADWKPIYMVTPDISGLNYLPALQAMVDNGVMYTVSDTSCSAENFVGITPTCQVGSNNGPNPGPNLPIINTFNPITGQMTNAATGALNQGYIYEVPRRPNSLFYNIGDPTGWQAEYDCIYAAQAPYSTYTAQNIKDYIANSFVGWMVQGDADPEMFHQTNLRAYDGTNSLLSDLFTDTFNLYETYFNLPVQSVDEDQLAQFMLNNMLLQGYGIVATVTNSDGVPQSIQLSVNNSFALPSTFTVNTPTNIDPAITRGVTVPITGLAGQYDDGENYGGQYHSHIPITAGQTIQIPIPQP